MGLPDATIESPAMRQTLTVVRVGLILSLLAMGGCSSDPSPGPGGGGGGTPTGGGGTTTGGGTPPGGATTPPSTALTGFTAGQLIPWFALFSTVGLLAVGWARRLRLVARLGHTFGFDLKS